MALVLVVLLMVAVKPSSAGATSVAKGTASAGESVSIGTWGASSSPSVLTFSANQSDNSTVTNTGTVALSQLGYTVVITAASKGSPTYTLFACTVAWVSGLCSGGSGTQIGGTFSSPSTNNVTSNVVPAVSGSVYLQATCNNFKNGSVSTTITLTVSVNSASQLRAPVATNQ